MKMGRVLVVVFGVLTLAACGPASLADQEHSVQEYYENDQLSADTLEACRARNDAEMRVMAAKPACMNVRAAQKKHQDEAATKENARWEAWAEERKQKREEAARESK